MGSVNMVREQSIDAAFQQIEERINSIGDLGDQEALLYAARDLLQVLKNGQDATSALIAKICTDRKLKDAVAEEGFILLVQIACLKGIITKVSDLVEAHLLAVSEIRCIF